MTTPTINNIELKEGDVITIRMKAQLSDSGVYSPIVDQHITITLNGVSFTYSDSKISGGGKAKRKFGYNSSRRNIKEPKQNVSLRSVIV